MLWTKQPRKELIVGEICVMKNYRFRSIVNFLDCYLRPNELWSKSITESENEPNPNRLFESSVEPNRTRTGKVRFDSLSGRL